MQNLTRYIFLFLFLTTLFSNEFKSSFIFNFGLNSFLKLSRKKRLSRVLKKGFAKGKPITNVSV